MTSQSVLDETLLRLYNLGIMNREVNAMKDKKMQIIQAAIKLFAERDYHTTSIQDIVSLAGVAKGSFYLHFHSKEELLVSIYNYFFDMIRSGFDQAASDSPASARKRLQRSILLQFEVVRDNKEIVSMQHINGAAFIQNGTIKQLLIDLATEMLDWTGKRIIEIYGPAVETYACDCAVMLGGLTREYIIYNFDFNVALDLNGLSEFILDRLDEIVQGMIRKNPPTFMPPVHVLKLRLNGHCEPDWVHCAEMLTQWINAHIEDKSSAETMLQSLNALVEELKKEQPNEIIVQGMKSYLLSLGKSHEHLREQLDKLFAAKAGTCS